MALPTLSWRRIRVARSDSKRLAGNRAVAYTAISNYRTGFTAGADIVRVISGPSRLLGEVYGNSWGCLQISGPTQVGELIWESLLETAAKSRGRNTFPIDFFHKRILSVTRYSCSDMNSP